MSYNYKDSCIILFAKYPEKGKVKTRLSMKLRENIAVELYKNFILDLLATLKKVKAKIYIFFYPEDSKDKFVKWLGRDYSYAPQKGDDLGERMKNAFIWGFKEGYNRIVIIGSDSPDLPSKLINEAFKSLEKNDVVIGPSFDGGYYLLGFKKEKFLPSVFFGIKWSTNIVFNNTCEILKKENYKIHVLPKWRDVDTINDLKCLFKKSKDSNFIKSKTFSCISKYRDMLKRK